MKHIFSLIRLIFYFSAIPILIFSIASKKQEILKTMKRASIGSIFYLICDLLFFESLFDLNSGLGPVVVAIITIPVSIIFLISAIVSNNRIRKFEPIDNKLKFRWTVIYVLPIILIMITFINEFYALNNAKLIFVNRPDGFSGDYYSIVVTDDKCIKVDLGDKFFKNGEYVDYYQYSAFIDENQEFKISSYSDEELREIDINLIKKLCDFNGYERRGKYLGDDYRLVWTINKIIGTNYYHVTYLANNGNDNSSGTVIGEVIFLNDRFIDDIQIGNYSDILFLKENCVD